MSPEAGVRTMMTYTELEREHVTLDVIHQRRAVRHYTPEKVDDTAIRTMLEAAVQAPTAMHREPWAFVVIQDRALLQRLSDRAKTLAQAQPTPHRDLGPFASPDFNIFYDAGTLIVVCGKPMGPFVTADCWLAAENLMLSACAMGLGTCCIGFAVPVLADPDVKRELGIPPDVTAVAPIIVGVPAGVTEAVGRKSPDVLSWIE